MRVSRYPRSAQEFDDLVACVKQYLLPGFVPPHPIIDRSENIRTHGSCFAENIANEMTRQGMRARHFNFKERANSPAINEQIFKYLEAPDMPYLCAEHEQQFPQDLLDAMRQKLTEAQVFIYSLGVAPHSVKNGIPVIFASPHETMSRDFKFSSVSEVEKSTSVIVDTLRKLNPNIKIVLTVSPVPLTAMTGMSSGIVADCVSKSILRAATFSYMQNAPPDVYYWPSFEMVRWVGGHINSRAYGAHDGHALHVNTSLVEMIVGLFMRYYVMPPSE